ncbi:MAG: manganese ABC transporter permease [Verrucomicrobia bacterium 61-8]|nr:metal ABC transporter permease [Verrucomicrobiota bacterium]OJV23077.1 MAG: manganese ABC transporter permease [Verrucomicrobia bacterium 61-8]
MNLFELFQYEFMQRALVACVLIGFTNGFIGAFVVLRRLALMADALSHSLLPGLAIAAMLVGLSTAGLLLGGLLAAFFVAIGGHLIARSSRVKDETAIASLYIIAFALGVAIIKFAHVKVSLDHFLFGNILGIANSDLWTSFAVSAIVLLCLVILHRPLLLALFEPSVAKTQGVAVDWLLGLIIVLIVLTMVSSLQAVGVLLSLGLMVLPAATIYLLSDSYSKMSWCGGLLGASGAVAGLILSYWTNIPSGPAIIMVLGTVFLAAYLFSPKYGIIIRHLKARHLHEESLSRWDEERH